MAKPKPKDLEMGAAKPSPRSRHLLKRFGITETQYDELLKRQDYRCAVCLRPHSEFRHRLCVDHDHSSGLIRGLLCVHCNRYVVGRHRKEKGSELLLAAYEYLTREYPGWVVPPKIKKRKRHGKKLAKRKRNATQSKA